MTHQFEIQDAWVGQRLDVALANQLGGSRNHWQQKIKQESVEVNGKTEKASYFLGLGDKVSVVREHIKATPQPSPGQVTIVFEDNHLVVVDKPAGLLVHSVARRQLEPTLAGFAATKSTDPDTQRPGIVHRLDRDTSGLIVIAKDAGTKTYLQDQFRERKVQKTYVLLVNGHLKVPEALIDLPIGRKTNSSHRVVIPTGKPAQTGYRVIQEYPGFSLIEAQPKTGRTHQLRVHFTHLGHSIAGDALYGQVPTPGLKRLFLHASKLSFTGPTGQALTFESPLPAVLEQFLKTLRSNV